MELDVELQEAILAALAEDVAALENAVPNGLGRRTVAQAVYSTAKTASAEAR